MVWIKFFISAALIVLAATQLAKYGDIIAIRTRLGGMFIGILLPQQPHPAEVLTSISSQTRALPILPRKPAVPI